MSIIKSVLIVDDNEDDQYIVSRTLLRSQTVEEKESIFTADNGHEAIAFLSDFKAKQQVYGDKFPPTVILLDINMPIMDGFAFLEAYEEITPNLAARSPIVLMLTSSENEKDIEKSKQFSCVKGYITKPLNKKKISSLLEIVNNNMPSG